MIVHTLRCCVQAAVEAGVDWDCYGPFSAYSSAVTKGLLKEALLDQALTRVLAAHVKLGFFDPPSMVVSPLRSLSCFPPAPRHPSLFPCG